MSLKNTPNVSDEGMIATGCLEADGNARSAPKMEMSWPGVTAESCARSAASPMHASRVGREKSRLARLPSPPATTTVPSERSAIGHPVKSNPPTVELQDE